VNINVNVWEVLAYSLPSALGMGMGWILAPIVGWQLGMLYGAMVWLLLSILTIAVKYRRMVKAMWPHNPDPYWWNEGAVNYSDSYRHSPEHLEYIKKMAAIPQIERDRLCQGEFKAGDEI